MSSFVLLIGDDFHSQVVADLFLRTAVSEGWTVQIVLVPRNSKASSNEMMLRWRKLETTLFPALLAAQEQRDLPRDHIGLVADHFLINGAALSATVEDVNDAALVARLARLDPHLFVSVRCYQKFTRKTIAAFATRCGRPRLLNLHPGRLPAYRGVMTYAHQLAQSDLVGTHSLHVVAPNWDDGPILHVNAAELSVEKTLASNYFYAATQGAEVLVSQFRQCLYVGVENYLATSRYQNENSAAYYSQVDALRVLDSGAVGLFNLAELQTAVETQYGLGVAERFPRHVSSLLP